jgi:LytS/YehU family sensor histidine kinase
VGASIAAGARGNAPRLVCVVEDNGPGMSALPPRSGAIGLKSVRRRLELKYVDAVLRCETSERGTRWTVDLPSTSIGRISTDGEFRRRYA